MRLLLLIFSFSISLTLMAEECHIRLYPRYILISEMSAKDLFRMVKRHNCSGKIIRQVTGKLVKYEQQSINTRFLIQSLGLDNVKISPSTINVQNVAGLLKDRTKSLSRDDFYSHVSSLTGEKVISINPSSSISISCNRCNKYGEINALMKINSPFQVKSTQIWIRAKKMTSVNALISKKQLGVDGTPISLSNFERKKVETTEPHIYSIHEETLGFFKLNKPLNIGVPLSKRDILPITLVHTGRPVQMKLKTSAIELTGSAIPRTSGSFGDSIQLTHPQSGRIIVGKVVDKNKVVVEL